jgi:PIN domain nuclease of toxin-antitoxin system
MGILSSFAKNALTPPLNSDSFPVLALIAISQTETILICNSFAPSNSIVLAVEDSFACSFIHRDPFDRLLVATAKAECMTILSADENIHQYDVPWIW